MDKLWLKNYPEGVAQNINLDDPRTLVDLFKATCQQNANALAYTSYGVSITYGDMDRLTHDLAVFFQQEWGLKRGDRIALMMPNILQYPVALFAALRAGLIVVNVNPLYTPAEVSHQIQDAQVKAIIVLENFAHTLQNVPLIQKRILITKIGDLLGGFKGAIYNFGVKYLKKQVPNYELENAHFWRPSFLKAKGYEVFENEISPDDIAFLQYTGGTTGVAKGAMLTHKNLIANLEQIKTWISPTLKPNEQQMILTALPLYHVFSLTVNCLLFTALGGHSVLVADPRDIPGLVKVIQRHQFTAITGVNTLVNALTKNELFKTLDFSSLNLTFCGGMAVLHDTAMAWQEITGKPILEGYGLTEASPVVAAMPANQNAFDASIGFPLPSTDIKIISDSGSLLGVNEPGELLVKGPQVMQGYWNNQSETDSVIDSEGWLKTGDVAMINENGRIFLLERKKDMIIVSGFNVYPNEIEDVIADMPGVFEVAVIGVADAERGEMVKAYVVKQDVDLTEDDILNYCHTKLTKYKIPKIIEFTAALPKTAVGKISRKELRETCS